MSWETYTVGEVLRVLKNGINCKQNKDSIGDKITRIETISDHTINCEKTGYSQLTEEEKEKSKLEIGDILFSHINSPIHVGKTAIYQGEEDLYHGINLLLMRTIDKVNPRFFNYFLKNLFSSGYWRENCKQAVNQASVNQQDIKKIPCSYPSLPVQKKIVKKLDSAFADIDKAINATQKNIENTNSLLESYVKNKILINKDRWTKATIGEFFDLRTGGTPSKKKEEYFKNGTILWLVSGDVNQEEIFNCDSRITKKGLENSNAKYLPVNSVLMALNGQGKTRGTVAMLRVEATCNQSLVSIFPKEPNTIISEYLYFNLKCRYDEIRRITGDSGNDRRGLNMPLIRKISFSFPKNIEKQKKFVKDSKNLLRLISSLLKVNIKKLSELENLKSSILTQAFSGELIKDAA